jgi:hypothetical protein
VDQEAPALALSRVRHWLRTVTNPALQTWRAASLPVQTIEERRWAGPERTERDLWEEESEHVGATEVVAVTERSTRLVAEDAEKQSGTVIPMPVLCRSDLLGGIPDNRLVTRAW